MFSSSPRSTPNRRQSSVIEHIPFSTNISHLSSELSKNDSAASSPCRSDVSFGGSSSFGGHSFRDQEHQKKSLEEENFKLKLRVYMLEERLQRQDSSETSNKALAELKVQSAALREELAQKSSLLRRALETLQALEERQSEQQARARQEQSERALLEDTLEELEAQYRAEMEQHEATEEERRRMADALRTLQAEQRRTEAARARREAERAEQERFREEQERNREEQERNRMQEKLKNMQQLHEEAMRHMQQRHEEDMRILQKKHEEEARRSQQLSEENARLQALISRRPSTEDGPPTNDRQETRSGPAENGSGSAESAAAAASPGSSSCSGSGTEASLLRRQLAAASGERRLEKAMAAAALQLQTERVRSLQASVQTVTEQLRRSRAELAECRAERDGLLLLQSAPRASSDSQAALSVSTVSTTEGVDVIPEPSSRSLSREELLRRSDSPSVDLATWLGSMPRLRSESFEFPDAGLVGAGERDDRSGTFASPPVASPAPAHSYGAAEPAAGTTAAGATGTVRCEGPAAPPTADNSDWDTWSEPDRSVSRARIGLERSSLEPPPADAYATDTDNRPDRHRRRHSSGEARELESRVEGLRHVRDGLWAEVAICQKLVTAAGSSDQQPVVTMPAALLEDVQRLHQRLEDAVTASGRVCGRTEAEQWSPPPPELTLALTITQEELAEAEQKLSAAQQRAQRLRARLQQTRDRLQQAEEEKQQLQREREAADQQISSLTQRLEQTEAECARLAEAAARRPPQEQESSSPRRLRLQLERSAQRQQELELLVRRLSGQLRQLPPAGAEAAAAEQRVRHAEQQLLQLGRQRLRVQAEITRLRSRARLLQTQQSVRESEQAEAEATAAAAAAAAESDASQIDNYRYHSPQYHHQQHQNTYQQQQKQHQQHYQNQQQQQHQQQQRRRKRSSSATGHDESRSVRELESRSVRELTEQLEIARAEMEKMRAGAHDYEEAGISCTESTRSCELPLAPHSPGGPRLSSHSESDPLEPLRTSCGQPAYSSPDLGIESDCQRCSSRNSSATIQSQRSGAAERTPLPSAGEATPVAGAGAANSTAATRTALQEALSRLSLGRTDHGRATAPSAACRVTGQTQLLASRTRAGLRRSATGTASPAGRT